MLDHGCHRLSPAPRLPERRALRRMDSTNELERALDVVEGNI
jgi:hypothetical protein